MQLDLCAVPCSWYLACLSTQSRRQTRDGHTDRTLSLYIEISTLSLMIYSLQLYLLFTRQELT